MFKSIILIALLATTTLARTDLSGCTSSIAGASIIWYVPGTGELCQFLDCGGGRAPPKTDVPGCPLYTGTATYSPSYLPVTTTGTDTGTDIWAEASVTGSATRQELFTSIPTTESSGLITATTATTAITAAQRSSVVSSATSVSSSTSVSVSNSETPLTSTSTGPVSTGAAVGVTMNGDLGFAVAVAGLVGAAVL
ncbi:uncharacterized protein TRUGW13939_11645 [Talaromyces rugulosus]|uniref:Siderophore biosynthesis enzyme n=1 Tax=Talaromyces rugulosus TaxID=121627 RepID=A0A7H8RFI1_TALRU|nr:uncharacterized protein TRUGW13939_11645 [Talaromyces rugulosus]QKX64471.1 hypothetical protein TRUGW13939_11645 [Talaromyces rugulosus]